MQAKFFPTVIEPNRNEQINDLCSTISATIHPSESKFRLYPICNESGWYNTLNKITAAKPCATKMTRVALLLGESNLLSILPELRLHAEVIICNDINSDLNEYTQFLVHCLEQSSSRKEFEEHYKKQDNGQYCNPLAATRNIDEEWKWLSLTDKTIDADSTIKEKHFLSSDERFILCKEQLSQLKIVWYNANLFNTSECFALSELLKKNQAIITLMNVTNLHMYTQDYIGASLTYPQSIQRLLYSNPSPIILYSIGESYDSALSLRNKISFSVEDYVAMLDESIIKYRLPDFYLDDEEAVNSILADNLTKMANVILKKLAIEHGIDLTYIPTIIFDKSTLSIRFDFNNFTPRSESIPKNIRPQFSFLLKGLLRWSEKRFLDDEEFFQENLAKDYLISLKDKKIYHRVRYDFRRVPPIPIECKIVDQSSFNNLINELEHYKRIGKLYKNRQDTYSLENVNPKLKEFLMNSIGCFRFELSRFDKSIDLYSLALFVKKWLPIFKSSTIKMEDKLESDSESFRPLSQENIEKFLFSVNDSNLKNDELFRIFANEIFDDESCASGEIAINSKNM